MKKPFLMSLAVLSLSMLSFAWGADAPKAPSKVVGKVTKVDFEIQESEPPNLVVIATGEVPTGGYTKTALERVRYNAPPKDGIQDYKLTSTPPDGPAIQVISSVTARETWKAYTKEAPWLKGVRIHGAGDGVMVKMLK